MTETRPPRTLLGQCETLMLDMDGTLLDLAYDNYMWLTRVPQAYAERHELTENEARQALFALYERLKGTLDWYCLDHWSDRLGVDVLALHREHRARIDYLPGAERLLETVAAARVRVLLVTNSHRQTLSLKSEMTGLDGYFDEIYTSHELGYAKEERSFWEAIESAERFDPDKTVFVDDTASVLESARGYGLRRLLHVTRPDTGRPARRHPDFLGIESVAELVPERG